MQTLIGLGPPEAPDADPAIASRVVPETLRPWALPAEESLDSSPEPSLVRVPLAPLIPGWGRAALGVLALGAAASVGFFVGRNPPSPRTAAGPPEFQRPAIGVPEKPLPAPPPAQTARSE
ncbi:MAG TPA: hypothetical protein VHE30_13540, partial [Polyangiaceae bacterium]|nr:hypothetical protein [Polyangiaceae bacterium]